MNLIQRLNHFEQGGTVENPKALLREAIAEIEKPGMHRAAAFELLRQFVVFLDEEDYATVPMAEVSRFLDDTEADE